MSTVQDDEQTDINELLRSVGLGVSPATREDQVYDILTSGPAPRIDNCRIFLTHQLAMFHFLTVKENKKITTDVVTDGKAVAKQLNNIDYAKLILKYYLHMHHLPWFIDLNSGSPKADIAKVIDMLLAHTGIKAALEKKW